MKIYRATTGPFAERPFFSQEEIEDICSSELHKVGLFPGKPEPIRIERFVEKCFGVTPEYDELPVGLLGFTKFGPRGVEGIVVSRALAEDQKRSSERRINSTLAHEAGHGLLHTYLFMLKEQAMSLFGSDFDQDALAILCREEAASPKNGSPGYDGKWWEYQANQTIGALLLPRILVEQCLDSILTAEGTFGLKVLKSEHRDDAVKLLAEVFDVNPVVARIRLSLIYPETDLNQLTL